MELVSSYFQNSINDVFASLNEWFKAYKFTLNFDKTNFMKFSMETKRINLNIGYYNKTTEVVGTTKFLGLQIDNN
jgi:protein involved in sex pheromone biosynthesis